VSARFLAGAGAPDADVDDLVQETFIRAFRSVDRFRGLCQFRTWLLTIGGNVLKDFGRRAARRKVTPLDDGVRDMTGDPLSSRGKRSRGVTRGGIEAAAAAAARSVPAQSTAGPGIRRDRGGTRDDPRGSSGALPSRSEAIEGDCE